MIYGGFTGAEIGCFSIDSTNSYFSANTGGVLCNKSQTTLTAYPSNPSLYSSGVTYVAIPTTVTTIGDYAFTNYKATSITIPSSITYVGRSAFQYSSLQSITFSGNPNFYGAHGESVCAFDDAQSLSSIKINGTDGNYSTDSYGMLYNKDKTKFVYCPMGKTSAFNVARTCTEIVDWAFHYSNAKPVIYDNVTKISLTAFDDVKSNFKLYCLKDTQAETFAKNNNISYGYHFEYSINSDNTITITKYSGPYTGPSVPNTIKGKTVTTIGSEAFKGNTSLQGIYLSSTNITNVGDDAFYGCTSLKNIFLPSDVTSIGKKAFYNTAATSITIPSSMTTIGEEAFYGMFKLENISIPSKVKTVGNYAFGFCSSIKSVNIPNNVTQVNFAAFYGCSKLTSLNIGTGLKTIGGSAFCNTSLTSQYIPKTVTSVGSYAFGYTYTDSKYTRNNSFTEISGYPNTAAQTYANSYDIPFKSVLDYEVIDNNSIKITKYKGTDTTVVIPAAIDGLPVTAIESYAFNGTNVTSVTLPSSMTTLNGYAFYGASKLTSVTFPSSITSIGNYAFEFCTSLKSITIPNTITSIGKGAFYGCTSLSAVNLGTGMKKIGNYAFTNTALTKITIPKSTTSIGDHAFGYTYENSTYTPVNRFTMTGYAYTVADTYTTNNSHITFNPLYESITNTSTISSTAITLGDSVTINCSATGGKTPFQYGITYSVDGSDVYPLQGYSSNSTVNFTPTSAGKYSITVNAKDDRGYYVAKNFIVIVDTPDVKIDSKIDITDITIDDTVTVTTGATGGNGNYTYSVFYRNKGVANWQTAIENTTKKTFSFKLMNDDGDILAGEYEVIIKAFDTDGKYDYKTFSVVVYERLVNTSEINMKTAKIGDKIIITASAAGGNGGYTYSYYYTRDSINYWVNAAGSDNSFTFVPSYIDTYKYKVVATDNFGRTAEKVFDVTVQNELTNTSTVSDTEITLGDKIYVTPSAEGGSGNYTYAVLYRKKTDTSWVNKQNFLANTENILILPSKATDYEICVKVKDNDGTIVKKFFDVKVKEAKQELINNSTMSNTNIAKGSTVALTGAATGGSGSYQYQFVYKKKTNTKWTIAQNFAENKTVTIQPSSAVDYDVCIKVKDSEGTIAKKFFDLTVTAQTELTNNSTISVNSIVKGNCITLTGVATGGSGSYQYQFVYKKKTNTKWTIAQNFDENSTVTIQPANTGEYDVCIKVKDSAGTIVKKFFDLKVAQVLASNSTISSTSITKGQTVTVNVGATGGTGEYTYAVYYKQKSQTTWTTKQNFTFNETVTIKPANATTYDVCVKVKDSDGTIAKQYFEVIVE